MTKEEITSFLKDVPVSDSSFRTGAYSRIVVRVTGIGYTIQAFFREEMLFSVTDFDFFSAVQKFLKAFDNYSEL